MGIINSIDGELSDSKGKSGDGEADAGVENSIFSFFGFAGVASGSHILYPTNNNEYYGYNAEYPDNGADDIANDGFDLWLVCIIATSSVLDRG